MCFYTRQLKTATELKNRFSAVFVPGTAFSPGQFNGFEHPLLPVVTNLAREDIQLYRWGLLPAWAKDISVMNHTLNARAESLSEKPSYRDVIQNRCLVLIDGYYEWQWLDPKGKQKKKYLLSMPDEQAFAMAGLWSQWTDPCSGDTLKTFTIVTTEANKLMTRIHNSKKRMPLLLAPDEETRWLNDCPVNTVGLGADALVAQSL